MKYTVVDKMEIKDKKYLKVLADVVNFGSITKELIRIQVTESDYNLVSVGSMIEVEFYLPFFQYGYIPQKVVIIDASTQDKKNERT